LGKKVSSSMTADELVSYFDDIYNGRYIYAHIIDYQNATDKIVVICAIHGNFRVSVNRHMYGMGCPKCSKEAQNKRALENGKVLFFKKVGVLWPDYDFSDFVYTGSSEYSTVRCALHGEFQKKPDDLLAMEGCLICKRDKKFNILDIKGRLEELYENRYTYPDLTATKMHDVITIVCRSHGEFQKKLGVHLRGSECPKCLKELLPYRSKEHMDRYHTFSKNTRYSIFVKKALLLFGDTYDYSNVEYVNSVTKVKIVCPIHGMFEQAPYKHITSSTGCPYCGKENRGYNYVKIYESTTSGSSIGTFYKLIFTHIPTGIKFLKIGITKNVIDKRYRPDMYKDFSFEVLEQIHDTNLNCAIMERAYKRLNKDNKFVLPKSIDFGGRSEVYNWDEKQQLEFKGISFLRESILEKQGGVCAICHLPPKRPVLDHDHQKKVKGSSFCRGVVCSNCNLFLAKIENNAGRFGITRDELSTILREIADYHEAEQTTFIHPTEKPRSKTLGKQLFNKIKKEYTLRYPKRKPLEYPQMRGVKKTKLPLLTDKWVNLINELNIQES